MKPHEFKAIRHSLGLSARRLAAVLGVATGRTVRRWEQPPGPGNRPVPGPVRKHMKLLERGDLSPEELEEL